MLFVVWCVLLFAVCCGFVVRCLLFVVFRFVDCSSFVVVRGALFAVWLLLFVAGCAVRVVRCLLCVAWCVLRACFVVVSVCCCVFVVVRGLLCVVVYCVVWVMCGSLPIACRLAVIY